MMKIISKCRVSPLLILLIMFIDSTASRAQENINNTLINKLCLISIKSKIKKSSNNFSPEFAKDTCYCFTNKVKSGVSFRKSRAKCKTEVLKKYNMQGFIGIQPRRYKIL